MTEPWRPIIVTKHQTTYVRKHGPFIEYCHRIGRMVHFEARDNWPELCTELPFPEVKP